MSSETTTVAQQAVTNPDFEIRSLDAACMNEPISTHPWWHHLRYVVAGVLFGIVLVKGELTSWFRMQEMFRLQSFYMYGVIGSAIVVGMLSVWFIKRFNIKTMYGQKVVLPSKKFSRGQIYGGLLFGFGWAITGACPGPLFAQIGNGATVIIITLLSAIGGTWVYGKVRNQLPH